MNKPKHISAVIFDLDGTLVRYQGVEFESSWGAIGAAAGVKEEWDLLLAKYFPRPDAYAEWMSKNARLLAGVPVEQVTKKVLPPPYATGVPEAICTLRKRYLLGILSSGVDLVAEYVCKDLGFEFAVANRLLVRNSSFTGETETIVGLWEKADVMRQTALRIGLPLSEICYVGDHVNDVPVMDLVGLSIAFNPKVAELEEVADYVTRSFADIPMLIEEWQRT